jgi:hypothetical protein
MDAPPAAPFDRTKLLLADRHRSPKPSVLGYEGVERSRHDATPMLGLLKDDVMRSLECAVA